MECDVTAFLHFTFIFFILIFNFISSHDLYQHGKIICFIIVFYCQNNSFVFVFLHVILKSSQGNSTVISCFGNSYMRLIEALRKCLSVSANQ